MSFGKLNILQHKSWNVWNRDNIEKVAGPCLWHAVRADHGRARVCAPHPARAQVLRDERLNREEEEKKRKRTDEVIWPLFSLHACLCACACALVPALAHAASAPCSLPLNAAAL